MLPLRVIPYFERPKPIPTGVAPVQRRPDSPTSSPLPALQPGVRPPYERRKTDTRRVNDRREKEQAAFRDTRTPQGRRRSPGRRATDQYDGASPATISISIKA